MEKANKKSVLIAGASFAGLTMAYWLRGLGYQVTVVEPDQTVSIIQRMGIFEQIKENRLQLEKWEFKNADDSTAHTVELREPGEPMPDDTFEIERDVLLGLLFDKVKNEVEFIFSNRILALQEQPGNMEVSFADGTTRNFDLVFGCDGVHSGVRKIWFGEEADYVHFLGRYFSIAVINELLIPVHTMQLYAEPNKGIMLNAYNHKTDIVCMFRPAAQLLYDYRNHEQLKQLVAAQMEGMGWRSSELKERLLTSNSFYFDQFCQVKMTSWTKGRVALVGDAAYCASPAAGMGGSLAIIGATALADALVKHGGHYATAFAQYNNDLRPFIEEVQAGALAMLDQLLPRTAEEVAHRNKQGLTL